jgi:thioredoxin-related protein
MASPSFRSSILSSVFASVTLLNAAIAGGAGWTHDFGAATKQAAAEGKELLLDFTGSDWCPPCAMLEKEVLSKPDFTKTASEKFVLVELDFPKDSSKIPAETRKQNEELNARYGIQGYPSILLCDADGRPYAISSGYVEGGPQTFLKHIDSLRARKAARDAAFTSASSASGVDKAKAYVAAFKNMELPAGAIASFYRSELDQIKAADPDDSIGYFRTVNADQQFNDIQNRLTTLMTTGKFKDAITELDKVIGSFSGEQLQALLLLKAIVLQQRFSFDDALKALADAKAVKSNDELNEQFDSLRAVIESSREAFNERIRELNLRN